MKYDKNKASKNHYYISKQSLVLLVRLPLKMYVATSVLSTITRDDKIRLHGFDFKAFEQSLKDIHNLHHSSCQNDNFSPSLFIFNRAKYIYV